MFINNTVNNNQTATWGIPKKPLTNLSPQSMGTAQTTPMVRQKAENGKNVSSSYAPNTAGAFNPSTTGLVPTAPSTYAPTSNSSQGVTSAPTRQQQIDSIKSQALGIQGQLSQGLQSSSPVKGILPPPTKFGSIVGDIQNASGQSDDQRRLLYAIEQASNKNREVGANAAAKAEQYGSEIARIGKLGAGAVAGNLSTGSNVVGSGNAAIASQSASQRMSALGEGLAAELQGTGQQLTANEQQTTGLTSALSGANTGQQLQLTGLGSAATFAQPATAGYGQTVFDPLTGQFTGGSGGLDPQGVATQLAQAVRSGQMTYEQAVSSLGYAGGAGQQFLNNALGPGFNAPQSSATIAGQTGVLSQLPMMEAADVAAEGIKNKIGSYLSNNPQLNPSDLAVGNKLQQWIEGKQLTDPKYQTFFNYLNEYTNTLAPILGVGGDPTNLKTEIAQSFVNAAASGQSITEVLENMQRLSRGKIQDLRSGATGGGVVSSAGSYGAGGGFAEAW